ncbi:plastocyanin [Mycobacterium frederiksbergense]|uniref:Plastocyanin n=1 Tax=Mycolicibacterium frederiksbergense TaxID=117567 RepID=A0ABT6KU43_9MYCO|nr:cupredoxin domain-containing protein [Mycolicibacterium frederiksbergense]MDH6194244.1 plastocyanin [Mycolicibacterium frederiksbergense]
MMRTAVWVTLVVLGVASVAASVAACGPVSTSGDQGSPIEAVSTSPSAPAPTGPVITIEGMGYSAPPTVAPGTQITIVNTDEVEHSVTSRTRGVFDVRVKGKGRATLTAPHEAGEYAFYCVYHPGMMGTLTVR